MFPPWCHDVAKRVVNEMNHRHCILSMCSWTALVIFELLAGHSIEKHAELSLTFAVPLITNGIVLWLNLRKRGLPTDGHSLCVIMKDGYAYIMQSNHNESISRTYTLVDAIQNELLPEPIPLNHFLSWWDGMKRSIETADDVEQRNMFKDLINIDYLNKVDLSSTFCAGRIKEDF
jgi:hypothetical protein